MPEPLGPVHLIAGGRGAVRVRGPDPLLRAVIEATGIPEPRVAYVGAASGDNAAFRVMIAGMLKKAGAGEVVLAPLCGRRADPVRARAVLSSADLVLISGGDVEEGMKVLARQRMIPFLRGLRGAGKRFFGLSAGSIMLAHEWVRWKDPHDDASAELFPCLGFAPVLCDTHGEADGWSELKAALALRPTGATGYGIVSGAALVVRPDGSLSALGGEVHVFRKRRPGPVQVGCLSP